MRSIVPFLVQSRVAYVERSQHSSKYCCHMLLIWLLTHRTFTEKSRVQNENCWITMLYSSLDFTILQTVCTGVQLMGNYLKFLSCLEVTYDQMNRNRIIDRIEFSLHRFFWMAPGWGIIRQLVTDFFPRESVIQRWLPDFKSDFRLKLTGPIKRRYES